jgi:hypothetical protein
MKDLVILVLTALALFFLWNGRQTATYAAGDVNLTAPVPPLIIQAIIEKVQSMKPDMAPIDTMFVNIQPDGSYNSRIMFFDTKHFLGTQYDINAKVNTDGSVEVLKIGDSSTVDPTYGYQPDKYQTWTEVTANLDAQFKGALQGYKNQKPQPNLNNMTSAYNQGMTVTQTNLQSRS